MYTDDEIHNLVRLVQTYRTNYPKFAREQLKIESSDYIGQLRPFILNKHQIRLDEIKLDCIRSNIPVRIKILKARRMGISTHYAGDSFQSIWGTPGYKCEIVCHQSDASAKILQKLQLFDANIDQLFKPLRIASNANELVYRHKHGLRSSCGIKTAESPNALRSSTNLGLHLSEVSFWNNAEECALAILQTVKYVPGTQIIFECTANGMSGYWYDFWYADNGYIPVFFGWQEFDDYRMPVPEGFVPTDDELVEQRRLSLTIEQIVWRRWCIAANCGGDLRKFMQEYPGTPQDAFQSTGECRFSFDSLRAIEADHLIKSVKYTGSIEVSQDSTVRISPRVHVRSEFNIFKPYIKRNQYALFCDVSEGLTRDKGKTPDNSVIKVFSLDEYEQVAEWIGLKEPADVGLIEAYIARAYGACIVVQEINNHGHAAMAALIREAKYPKALIFTSSSVKENDINAVTRYGWLTNAHTRALAVDDLAIAIQNLSMFKLTRNDLMELYSFTAHRAGQRIKYMAGEGKHDDRVMTLAIAEHLLTSNTFMQRYRVKFKEYECCKKCQYYVKYKCDTLGIGREADDCCRLFSMNSVKSSGDFEFDGKFEGM